MNKYQQYGDFVELEAGETNVAKQIEVMKDQLAQIEQVFELEEFKGLTLADFRLEFILKDHVDHAETNELLIKSGLEPLKKGTKWTVGWKITKKR